jgi:hypothetical protein
MNRLRRLISNKAKRHHPSTCHGETLPQAPVQSHPSNHSEASFGTSTEFEAEDPHPNENAYAPRLPAEIWLQIINLVEGNGDKLSLSRVSSLFRALIQPSFKTIDLFPNEAYAGSGYKNPDELSLLLSLRGTQLASIVTSFTIKLTCTSGWKLTKCMCLELDDLLSTVFKAMVNLVHLDIHCKICCSNATHRCLTNISARGLRSLSFQCRCSALASLHLDTSLTPAMLATLESLRWYCSPLGLDRPKEGTLTNPNLFLKLNALVYSGNSMDDKLIATLPVGRVWVLDLTPGTEEAFGQALSHDSGGMVPVGLEYVIFTRFVKLGGVVAANPRWFENLRHIGTLPYIPKDGIVSVFAFGETP